MHCDNLEKWDGKQLRGRSKREGIWLVHFVVHGI